MVVKIYLGSADLLKDVSADVQVSAVADYVGAYDRIVRALHASQELSVSVGDRNVAAWLRRLVDQYGAERVRLDILTRRQRLGELWRVAIPEQVADEQIARAGLLDVKIAARPGSTFDDFVLEIFFSPYLAQPRLPLTRLGDLLKSYRAAEWAKTVARPLIGDIYRARMHQWQECAEGEGERLIADWLLRAPDEVEKRLGLVKALAGYPIEVGQRVLGVQFDALVALNLDLSGLTINETQVAPALDQIAVHLAQLLQSQAPAEALETLLNQVCGCLEVEYDSVDRLLRSGSLAITGDMIHRIRERFAPLASRPHLEQALADLDLLVSRPKPVQPDPDPNSPWTEDQWLAWAEREYLPYRFWLEEVGQLGEDVADLADQYGEWLYARYAQMRLSSPRMLHRALPDLKGRLSGDKPVLALVIDNFNAKFFRDLARSMLKQGYYCDQVRYQVALLPSCTEISKKSLLTGQPEPFAQTAYEKIVQDVWTHELPGRRVLYLPHVGALRAVKRREHDVYFLNYLPLDMTFHNDAEQMGLSHAQAARNYLAALAQDVRAFGERIGAGRDMQVIVLSDHGSTRIPPQAPNLIDEAFFAKRVTDKHHRYVTISDDELAQLPENIKYQCYVFEAKRFGLASNYLAAKRYYRFLPTSEACYIHGGLTPEETLVPVAIFTPALVAPKPLLIRLIGNAFYIQRKSELQFEITNSNAYPCESLVIEPRGSNIDAPAAHLGELNPMSQGAVSVFGRFRRTQGGADELQIHISYTFLGQTYEQEENLEIVLKAMARQATNLTELMQTR